MSEQVTVPNSRDAADCLVPYVKRPRCCRSPSDQTRPPKRHYIRVSDADRHNVINLFANEGKTAEEIAHTLDGRVSVSNVHHIIRTYQKEDRIDKLQTGGSKPKYTNDERQVVAQIHLQHYDWTYQQIRHAWKQQTGSNKLLSIATIVNILHEFGVTTKQRYNHNNNNNNNIITELNNSEQVIMERFYYAQQYIKQHQRDEHIIYVDIMGFSLHRSRRRSLAGRRATITHADERGGNISVCAAISPKYGLLNKKGQPGAFDSDSFMTFLIEVFRALPQTVQHQTHYVIMDNNQFHRSHLVNALFAGIVHKPVYPPPYSPQLNAIEECLSSVAAYVNTQSVNNQSALLELIDHALDKITANTCARWHQHVVEWLQHGLEKKPILSRISVDTEFYQQINVNYSNANVKEEEKDNDDTDSDNHDYVFDDNIVDHNDKVDIAGERT